MGLVVVAETNSNDPCFWIFDNPNRWVGPFRLCFCFRFGKNLHLSLGIQRLTVVFVDDFEVRVDSGDQRVTGLLCVLLVECGESPSAHGRAVTGVQQRATGATEGESCFLGQLGAAQKRFTAIPHGLLAGDRGLM